mgnify:CR=1 FL=1
MRNVEKIFIRDIISLVKNPLALLIAVGLCVIPSLYAWFNIYSNWDPYGNTGSITIALASEDEGYDMDGDHYDMAGEIISEMLAKTTINYILVEGRDTAVQGVTSGEYYAAVVFDAGFSRNMMEGFLNGMERPKATYYENEKRNAVATKITDSAVSSLEDAVNKKYVSMVVSNLFSGGSNVYEEISGKNIKENILEKLDSVTEAVAEQKSLMISLNNADEKLIAALDTADADMSALSDNLDRLKVTAADIRDNDLDEISEKLSLLNADVLVQLSDAVDAVHEAENADVAEQKSLAFSDAARFVSAAKRDVDNMIDALQFINSPLMANSRTLLLTALSNASARLGGMQGSLEDASANASDPDRFARTASEIRSQASLIRDDFSTTTISGISNLSNAINETTSDADIIADHAKEDIELLHDILGSGKKSVKLMNKSVSSLVDTLDNIESELTELAGSIDIMGALELDEKLTEFIKGDPDEYGDFFSHPVKIQDMPVYAVENYGSGVAPFYTTLAIWVGGVVLVSLIKVHADRKGLINVKDVHLYLGRLMLFLLLGLVQTALIVWGDLYLIGIQCVDPPRFLLASFAASITFMLLIYSFTISFGDIGKAVIVVIMVIQIAGSSGTYPIEILPAFYRQVYIFFPFPYAINAMREAVAGTYESDYLLYLLQLSLFAVFALVLGIFIRRPFKKVLHFMEKRMEDTEIM